MKVTELNNEQREELKQRFLEELWYEKKNETVYGASLGDADELVTDEFLNLYYEETDFSPNDFFCTTQVDESDVADTIAELLINNCVDCDEDEAFMYGMGSVKRIDDNIVDVSFDRIGKHTFRITVDRID